MSTDPELADAPDTPQDIAWEARHCADRLASLAELFHEPLGDGHVYWSLWQAADAAEDAAYAIDGKRRKRR